MSVASLSEELTDLFCRAGFEAVEVKYCTVYNKAPKKDVLMKRVWIHGEFRKPHKVEATN